MRYCLNCNASIDNTHKLRKYCNTNCKEAFYYKQNTTYYKLKNDSYYYNNKPKYFAKAAKRRAGVKKATPTWANLDDIENVYIEAQYLQMHVDHIIPLKHPLVCGLHVWENLQLLTPKQNLEKSNKFIIE